LRGKEKNKEKEKKKSLCLSRPSSFALISDSVFAMAEGAAYGLRRPLGHFLIAFFILLFNFSCNVSIL